MKLSGVAGFADSHRQTAHGNGTNWAPALTDKVGWSRLLLRLHMCDSKNHHHACFCRSHTLSTDREQFLRWELQTTPGGFSGMRRVGRQMSRQSSGSLSSPQICGRVGFFARGIQESQKKGRLASTPELPQATCALHAYLIFSGSQDAIPPEHMSSFTDLFTSRIKLTSFFALLSSLLLRQC